MRPLLIASASAEPTPSLLRSFASSSLPFPSAPPSPSPTLANFLLPSAVALLGVVALPSTAAAAFLAAISFIAFSLAASIASSCHS